MQSEFSFCYTEGKPQTLVMLKDVKSMPELLFAPSEENVFVWVGPKDEQNILKVRDEVERDLGQCIYHYATVEQAVQQLKKDRPQYAILIVMIQYFQSWKLLNDLDKVKTMYFYSESDDYQHFIRPFWYQQMEKSQNTDQSQLSMFQSEITEQENIAQQWRENICTEISDMAEKLRKYKGTTTNHLKILPNFIFMAKQMTVSHSLVRTMYSMLNQEIDDHTKTQINRQFEDLLEEIGKMDSRIKQEQKKKYFFQFISSSSHPIKQIISWYTNETFLYRFVNNLLRSHRHPAEIFYVQPYVKLLFNTIKQLYMEQSKERSEWSFVCYRGGNMEQKQFELFQKYKGETVQNLGFLSTSLNKQTAERFLKKGNLFIEIGVKERKAGTSEFGFANIQDFSKFCNEQEILFNPLNTFQIIQVSQKEGQYFLVLNYLLLDDNENTKIKQGNGQQPYWAHIAKLQRQQKYLNICQGNSLTNQYYNLQGADAYWKKYIKIIDQNQRERVGNQNVMKLRRAFAILNKQYFRLLNEKLHSNYFEIQQSYEILSELFTNESQIVKSLKKVHTPQFIQDCKIQMSQLERSYLLALPEYKFLEVTKFDNVQFMKGAKYLISQTLSLQNYKQMEDIQNVIMAQKIQLKKKIKYVNLINNGISLLKEELFLEMDNLVELNMSNNKIVRLSKQLNKLHNLRVLSLSHNQIGDDGAKELGLSNLLNLTNLDICNNQIGGIGAKGLATGNLNNLTTLNLSYNRLGNNGVKGLALGNLNNLTTLNLNWNQIGDDGAKGLALGNLHNLTTLNLRGNQLQNSSLIKDYFLKQFKGTLTFQI